MPVFIDDLPADITAPSLGEALLAAQRDLERAGRIIVEVVLDGQPLVGDELFERQEEALADSTLNLVTANPRELVAETLGAVHGQLDAARDAQTEAAACLQRDEQDAAMQLIGEAMTTWQQTERAVRESAGVMEISLDDLAIDGQPFSELTSALIEQLSSLRDLLEAHDFVAVADALQYEWPQTTLRWQKAIEELMEKING